MAETGTLRDVFVDELKDVYNAERQITKALPKMIKAAQSEELREALQNHLEETETQIDRLDRVFDSIEVPARGKHCAGMAGILEEGSDVLQENLPESVRDAALIAAAQRVEHYEMAAYGTLVAFARELGLDPAVELLEEILEQEKAADEKLTTLAEGGINAAAAQPAAEVAHAGAGRSSARNKASR
jgi:ferritin-like metal-binding protein YciE